MTKRILMTESDADVKFLLSSVLKSQFLLSFIGSGKEILEGRYIKPDLFILNSQLPDGDILKVCSELKSNKRTKNIPILIITSSMDAEWLVDGCPGDAFISEPFDGADLQRKIEIEGVL